MSDWRDEDRAAELWALIDMVQPVEEIEIARIRDLCEEHDISSKWFIEVWNKLCDEAHKIINQAEEKIH